jgi:DNA polymerase-3 subunit delta
MKIQPYKIESFINSITQNKEIYGALIYGPESGLVNINANKIANLIVPDRSDPFLISNIDQKRVDEDPGSIIDEFVSIPMLGGRKLIKINDASNKITSSLKPIFGNEKKATEFSRPVGENFILIDAKQLDPGSSLRKFAENNPYFASIACYEDNESNIKNIIRDKLKEYNLRAEDGVVDIIINQFGKNRLIILNELEKLALYMNKESLITNDIAKNVIADISQISTPEFIDAFFDLNLEKSNNFLDKLFHEKVNAIAIIRFLSNYLLKLYVVKSNVLKGESLEKEIKSQRIFFKQEASFKKHLNIWDLVSIKSILSKLQELEIRCKSSGSNPELLLASFNNFCFLKYNKRLKRN